MFYLRYLCLFAHSGVQHMLCCVLFVFFRLVYNMLPVYMDCPFWIGPSIFSDVYFMIKSANIIPFL